MRCLFAVGVSVAALWLSGCQVQPKSADLERQEKAAGPIRQIAIEAPVAWGGAVQCIAGKPCRLGVVEHEAGVVAVHELKGRSARPIDRHKVAYHPDSAVWMADGLLGAAVETTASIDVVRVEGERLVPIIQLPAGMGPRDVILVKATGGRYTLLATPYRGNEVSWIDWTEGSSEPPKLEKATWCAAPWHPVHVPKIPGIQGDGFVVGCLDDNKVIAMPANDRHAKPKVLASFNQIVPRTVRPSPSGKWLFISLETMGRNARINMETGELQWIASPLTGSVAVAPLNDDLVIWSDDQRLYLQRLDDQGAVQETRWYKTSGFSTRLQTIDIDGDGHLDVVVYNSGGEKVDVVYGPLWESAQSHP